MSDFAVKLEGAKYVGEAFPLGDHRYVVAHPDKQPYIIDTRTGETEELKPSQDKGTER